MQILGRTLGECVRWGIAGLGLNAVLYLGYLALSDTAIGYVGAMTITYISGIAAGYAINRRWSFGYGGAVAASAVRYVFLYVAGYVLNLAILTLAVVWFGASHAIVQGAMIFVMAVFFFLGQKLWVFKT